jgi:predicted Zn-dependent protease
MAEALEKQYTAKRVAEREDQLLELMRHALQASPADETQVRIINYDSALTRFANSEIHQNTFERSATVAIKARYGQQQGTANTNRLDKDGVEAAVSRACAAAKVSAANEHLGKLPEGPREYPVQVEYCERTAACTPEERARLVIKGFEASENDDFKAAGILSTDQVNVGIANSAGIEATYSTTQANYKVQWTGADSSGYAEQQARDISDVDVEGRAVKALATAKRTAKPRGDLPAGKYTVVLMPECVATMLNFLSWMGFSGRGYNEGTSFMHGKLGEPVTGKDITIVDDPLDERTLGVPCDMAGVPQQRLILVENGIARAVCHDTDTASQAGTSTTGHDTGGNFPLPLNLVLNPGRYSVEELISEVEHGVLVSRFHYTNMVDPMATVITGMTRDGTFLIENGELAGGLTNFRFTQNILEALKNCTGMAATQSYHGAFWGAGSLVPDAIRVDNFNFSGKTEH